MAYSVNRKRTVLALVLAATLAGAAVALPALATSTKKLYTAAISPTTGGAGASASYTFTLTNSPQSSQSLGSANVALPTSFTSVSVGAITAPAGKLWTATLSGSTIQIRSGATSANSLFPGQSVSVAFTAQNPCVIGTYTLTSQVKQSNDFLGTNNDFSLSGSNPQVVIGAGAPANVQFVAQPTDTQKTHVINGVVGVTTKVTDVCNNVVPGASVAIAIGVNPPATAGDGFVPAVLTGTSPRTSDSSGIATFNDLSIDQSSSGYTLIASLSPTVSTESHTFDITSTSVSCAGGICSATVTSGTSSLTVNAAGGTGTLSLTFESHPLDCSGAVTNPVGGTVTIDPPPSGATLPITATFDDNIPYPFQSSYPVCKTVESVGGTSTQVLQFCSDRDPVNALPCIKEQEIQFHGSQPTTLHTVVWMNATDPRTLH